MELRKKFRIHLSSQSKQCSEILNFLIASVKYAFLSSWLVVKFGKNKFGDNTEA